MSTSYPGTVFMVVAPSGAGKSSLVNALLANDSNIMLSISATTRAPRPGEADGEHYFFVDKARFENMVAENAMLEWAQVHDNYYGTPRDPIQKALGEGRDVLLEIDWQGARLAREHFPEAVGIFILPPSLPTLKARLRKRGQDSEETIARRVEAAEHEIAHVRDCQYAIINEDFDTALQQLLSIVQASRLRTATQSVRHRQLFQQLGADALLNQG
ncbi:guanylate kinase [Alcaligenes parafaecalis]|uniref:Guanylate kinase n=1 Tax=Alcaligenes parafaecalis TaxID=171260 RepID=A0ABT3VLN6_9BURK|nr:guanylate kinase [Alcaligenes parafaecalis]MCX5463409.1 guanylate kinase [Alcaligenes parafaecalis]